MSCARRCAAATPSRPAWSPTPPRAAVAGAVPAVRARPTRRCSARLASLGCGNPIAVADLHEGEVVLDLGSGGGIDVLLSARRVGPTGKAYGLDMTQEM